MEYCKNLQYEQKPDYAYLKKLIQECAWRYGIDLFDKVYDWAIRAVTIKNFPHIYDFIENQETNPLDDRGIFPCDMIDQA